MIACLNGNIEVVKYLLHNEKCPFTDLLAIDNVRRLFINGISISNLVIS